MAIKQSLTDFYISTLGANLANARWSWGAVNPVTNEVFLRVWANDVEATPEGERVQLYNLDWTGKSSGYPERQRHIQALQNGAQGYGVVCTKANPDSDDTTRIKGFDHETLLRLGEVRPDGRRLYAQVVDRVPVEALARRQTAESTLVPDLAALLKKGTTVEALVNARVGQGQFRNAVLRLWGGRCCVTGIETTEAIRASHIKPWRDSTDEERLDPQNGLPLAGTLDGLFDAGLITFAADGTLVTSPRLSVDERERLGILEAKLRRVPTGKTADCLAHHREAIFLDRP
jgi:putative restriction endonuclease